MMWADGSSAALREQAGELPGAHHLAARQLEPEGREEVAQRLQLGRVRRGMDAVHAGRAPGFERFRRGDVGGDHEFLDQAVRIEPLARADLGHLAVGDPHLVLGQVEIEGAARRRAPWRSAW